MINNCKNVLNVIKTLTPAQCLVVGIRKPFRELLRLTNSTLKLKPISICTAEYGSVTLLWGCYGVAMTLLHGNGSLDDSYVSFQDLQYQVSLM